MIRTTMAIPIAALTLLSFTACGDSRGGDPPTSEAGGESGSAPQASRSSPTSRTSPASGASASDYDPTASDEAEIVATLQRLFDALETGDAELLRSVIDASVVMHFAETTDGRTTFGSSTVDGLASRIASSEVPLIERMWGPVVVVHGPLATIWTPYDFYAGSTFSHCGIDTASLLRRDDGWTIVALSWTRLQPPHCELHPEGPPAGR